MVAQKDYFSMLQPQWLKYFFDDLLDCEEIENHKQKELESQYFIAQQKTIKKSKNKKVETEKGRVNQIFGYFENCNNKNLKSTRQKSSLVYLLNDFVDDLENRTKRELPLES